MLLRIHTDGNDEEEGEQEGNQEGDPNTKRFARLCGVDGQGEEEQVEYDSEPEARVVQNTGRHDRSRINWRCCCCCKKREIVSRGVDRVVDVCVVNFACE